MIVLFIITIFGVILQVYLQNSLIMINVRAKTGHQVLFIQTITEHSLCLR